MKAASSQRFPPLLTIVGSVINHVTPLKTIIFGQIYRLFQTNHGCPPASGGLQLLFQEMFKAAALKRSLETRDLFSYGEALIWPQE